jgi:hypothetical protein
MMNTKSIMANFVLFQLGWMACVLGGAGQWHWAGTVLVALIVFFHLVHAQEPRKELYLILLAVLLGALWDSALVSGGLLSYRHGVFHEGVAPHWIIAMWALFATTLNGSLRWLKGRWMLAVLFGAAGGPLAYYAGQKLGAVQMSNQMLSLMVLAAGWALMMPLLMRLSERYNGYRMVEAR